MGITFGKRRAEGHRNGGYSPTITGKTGATLFFLFFLAMGIAFLIFIAIVLFRNLSTYAWNQVDATVTHSRIVQEGNGDYRFRVGYEYIAGNRLFRSTGYDNPDEAGFTHGDYSVLQRLAMRYSVGSTHSAYVDPADASRAILVHPGLWMGLLVFLPLIFVAIGAGGLYFTWFHRGVSVESLTRRIAPKQTAGRWIVRGMGIIFTLIGVVASYFLLVGPLLRIHNARSWMPVPATVIASRVVSHRGDDSTTYSVDILYEYEARGRKLRSNRYHFISGSSSGHSSKQAIVDAHPPGRQITVYVNPADPFDSVIHRGLPSDWWLGLIPVVFCIAGLAMLIGSFCMKDKSARGGSAAWLPDAKVEQTEDPFQRSPSGRVTLKRTATPVGKLVGIVVGAVLWNAITGVMVAIAVNSHRAGNPEWFLTIFVIPFVLAGIGLIVAIPYHILALLNPSPVVEVNTATPSLGETLTIDWRLEGRADRVSTLTLSLVGEEHATYRRGTDTVTDKHTFYDEPLLETSSLAEIVKGGHFEAVIPCDVMHSFEADNNKITWTIRAAGDIKRWPDMKAEFRLVIQPMNPEAIAHA
ncbi:MAG: DUF3592 domain-containing protein [Thermoguttaceae bacterium]|jgi:hypothetical protein|nr:DUF3592 domain-containing protein [Thermoguttaceae bacterium]